MIFAMEAVRHVYEVRPRSDKRGVDLISDVLPFGRLWYDTADNAIGYAMHSCSADAIRAADIHSFSIADNRSQRLGDSRCSHQ